MKNIEKHKEELLKISLRFAVDKKTRKPVKCVGEDGLKCEDCILKELNSSCIKSRVIWLDDEYKELIELTRFEYDLLKALYKNGVSCARFEHLIVNNMKKNNGYFKGVKDTSMKIKEILENCVVNGDDEEC